MVVEGLSQALKNAKYLGMIRGIQISHHLLITHLLFVDDVLIFFLGSLRDVQSLSDIMLLFSKATRMEINEGKYTVTTHLLTLDETQAFARVFPFIQIDIDVGLKYLGFSLKPNDCRNMDWCWLIEKLEKRLKI